MDARAAELLEGPRGRRMLYELARASNPGLGAFAWDVECGFLTGGAVVYASWGSHEFGAPEVLAPRAESIDELATYIAQSSPSYRFNGDALVAALAASVDAARAWQAPDAADLMLADPIFDGALAPLAERAARMPEAQWWWHPIATEQTVTQFFYDDLETAVLQTPVAPDPQATPRQLARWRLDGERTERRFAEHAENHPGSPLAGEWWALPQYLGVWTAPALESSVPSGLHFVEDGSGEDRARVWPARAPADARVLEIVGPDDWAELCHRHPFDVSESRRYVWADATGRGGRWVIPDWPAVAREWDAVHVTAAAYLRAAERTIAVTEDTATVLAGWAPGATAWLTDALEIIGVPVDWVADGDDRSWVPTV